MWKFESEKLELSLAEESEVPVDSDSDLKSEEEPADSNMQQASALPAIKLNDTNYLSWSLQMEMFLQREGTWDMVENPPAQMDAQEQERDRRAITSIVLCLDESQLGHIREHRRTSREVWQTLKHVYVQDTAGARMALTRKLYHKRLEPGQCINSYVQEFADLFFQLRELGMEYTEAHRCYVMLSGLDQSWDVFTLTLESIPEADLTVRFLTSRFLDEERKRETRKEEAAKFVMSRPGGVTNDDCKSDVTRSDGRRFVMSRNDGQNSEGARTDGRSQEKVFGVRRCFICNSEKHIAKFCSQKKKKATKSKSNVLIISTCADKRKNTWLVDSGATQHVVSQEKLFKNLTPSQERHVSLANGKTVEISGQGSVYVKCLNRTLQNVLFVPSLKNNILSVSCLAKEGYTVNFDKEKCSIFLSGTCVATGTLQNNLYMICDEKICSNTVLSNTPTHDKCIHVLHRRLGHASFGALNKTLQAVPGLKVKKCYKFLDCSICKQSKSKAYPVSKRSNRVSSRPFELVHTDITGPMKTQTKGGKRFILTITDDFSRYGYVFLLTHKSEAFQYFKNWVNLVERRFSQQVAAVQSDRGGEYMSKQFTDWLRKKGIRQQLSNPSVSQENGVAERRQGMLQVVTDSLLADSQLPRGFWGEAVKCANYLINRLWSSAINETPYFLLHGRKPSLEHLRIFGSQAWVNIPKSQRRKGSPKARKLTFIGYQTGSKSFRFCDNHDNVYFSRSANFCENENWFRLHANNDIILPMPSGWQEENEDNVELKAEEDISEDNENSSESGAEPKASGSSPVIPRRSQRSNFGIPPERYQACINYIYSEPESYQEMIKLPPDEQNKWKKAMAEEFLSLQQHKVFSKVKKPENENILGCRWVYKRKVLLNDQIKYKARLVAQGFAQRKYLHYDEVFSPTAKSTTFRLLLTLAALKKYVVHHIDIETAYLNAPLQESIYMKQIPGFELENPNLVLKLNKALYGLKQSARKWNETLNEKLLCLGFNRSAADPCLYTKEHKGKQIYLLVFVDDLCFSAPDHTYVKWFISQLSTQLKLKHLGEIKNYLGVEIERDSEGVYSLSQSNKIKCLLQKYGMDNCNAVKTPMETNFQREGEVEQEIMDLEVYQSIIGSLLHISSWTRPDIAASVNILSQSASHPTQKCFNGIKRVLRYLKGSINMKLRLQVSEGNKVLCYTDSDWGSCEKDRKSISGLTISLGGALIVWQTRKQSLVATSTADAEYVALSELCNEIVWFKHLLRDVNININSPITTFCDNTACIELATDNRMKNRSKHICIKSANVRESVAQKLIELKYCPSQDNIADIFTKPLNVQRHMDLCEKMHLYSV